MSRTGRALEESFIFARFRARDGLEAEVAAAPRDTVGPSREESGCLAIDAYRSNRDPRLFYIHALWADEAAFETHAGMPHTVLFLERVRPLIDHPLEVTRAKPLGWNLSQSGCTAIGAKTSPGPDI